MESKIFYIECVLGPNSRYIIKNMPVIDIDSWTTQHWIFKHTFSMQNNKLKSVNKWLEWNYHQIPIEYGNVKSRELDRILKSLKFDNIYIKGEQKTDSSRLHSKR